MVALRVLILGHTIPVKMGCKYCYANFNKAQVETNCALHNLYSELLYGEVDKNSDKITERKVKSINKKGTQNNQLSFFALIYKSNSVQLSLLYN